MAAKSPARPAQGAPPSSPRLPSPPPLPELQLGPRSPSINAHPGELRLDNASTQDDGAARRVRPGTSASDMAKGPPFVPLHQLESPFQLQEYLKSSYCKVTMDESSSTVKPITKESAQQLATPPIQQDTGDSVDKNLWLYELCRFLVQATNRLIVSFFADNPPCSSQTCPEMRASEWQYLCAVHEPPKSCCAIDYCCHTLDWAANVLTSTKHFPSRLSLGGEGGSAMSMRQLTNIFRRVYRIYAHAWFQHREAFWMLEQEEGLYKFFKTVSDIYGLIPEDNYTIPPEAEGTREDFLETPVSQVRPYTQILRNDTAINLNQQEQAPSAAAVREPDPTPTPVPSTTPTSTTTTRRHRHTPSTGTQVKPISESTEEEEEEPGNVTVISQKLSPEQTATSTIQTISSSPPKPQPRSPRPEMSIPIRERVNEDIRAPEDPTPTPENHGSNPFGEAVTTDAAPQPLAATGETAIDENASTGTEESAQIPVKVAMPPLETSMPQPANENEEVRSPGGGSIRTVGGDILSGILAHTDTEDQKSEQPSSSAPTASTEIPSSDEPESKPEANSAPVKEGEDDEEMGEIKLEKTETTEKENDAAPDATSSSNDDKDEQPTAEAEPKSASAETKDDDDEKKETETPNADGTKKEDAPSGVV